MIRLSQASRTAGLAVALLAGAAGRAAPAAPPTVVFEMSVPDAAGFERDAALAAELGATHLVITADLPPAAWEFDSPGDPYPAWYVRRPSLLKLFPPAELQPYVDLPYAGRIAAILEERSRILRRHGLKGCWNANEPQVLPEAFFAAHPELRGPRVDQANRARVPRFAPCVDQPETLRLYRESLQQLLRRCPEIEIFTFLTTDSGSGFCWAPGLYPGANGPSDCRNRPMEERVGSFLTNLQDAARAVGRPVLVNLRQIEPRPWMTPTFADPMTIVRQLPRGLAVDNREGPDGRPFLVSDGGGDGRGPFYPVVGLPVPAISGRGADAVRRIIRFGDAQSQDFNVGLYRIMGPAHPRTEIGRLAALRRYAASLAGEPQADSLLAAWQDLDDAQRTLAVLDFGPMLTMGHVLNRWVNRPLVPFPEELKPAEIAYYRPFLLQAKGEAQAADVADIQAMRMYEGWGARLLFQRAIEVASAPLQDAAARVGAIAAGARTEAERRPWIVLQRRLEAVRCLLRSADDMVAYQAQLDRVKALDAKPDPDPVLGTQGGWDRADLQAIARREIDNTVRLRRLLQDTPEPLLDLAPTPGEETIMRLGPDLPAQLKRKIDLMNAHWEDYRRLFTEPNP